MSSPRGQSVVSLSANEDLRFQADWYYVHAGKEVAQRYLKAFDDCLRHLECNPAAGSKCGFPNRQLRDLRSRSFGGRFRVHRPFYRIVDDVVDVSRVLHGARDIPRRLLDPPGTED